MGLLLKIAFRNLLRHKGKSLSIGFVLVVGAFFMTVGNGFISGMQKGMDRNLVKTLFGDITLMPKERLEDTLSGRSDVLDFMENYEKIQKAVSSDINVERVTPIIIGKAAMLDLSNLQSSSADIDTITFWGMDFKKYKEAYSQDLVILEGDSLKEGERGILINANLREQLYFMHDIWLLPEGETLHKDTLPAEALSNIKNLITRNDLVLLGISGSITSTDIRVPIKGIFKFKEMSEALSLINDVDINLVDISTARDCMGYLNPQEKISHHTGDNQILLDTAINNPDKLFDDDVLVSETTDQLSADHIEISRQDNENLHTSNADNTIYNISQVNLKPDINLDHAVEKINSSLSDSGLGKYVRAVSWQDAWSVFSGVVSRTSLISTLFIDIIFLAAILMIANALSIAAMERAAEIGTMRVIGSQKIFIAGLFVMETSILSFFFGGLGIVMGITVIKLLSGMEITTENPVLQLMFGGSQFSPSMSLSDVVSGVIQLGIISIIAVIYPLLVVKNIKPIDATGYN